MIVVGTQNYQALINALAIPGIAITAIQFLFLPIYKVNIKHMD